LWAADTPLVHLAGRIGAEAATRAWQRVHRAVDRLAERAPDLDCHWAPRPELYLAGSLLDADGLAGEADLRRRAGLPSRLLVPDAIAERFGLPARAALLSDGVFGVDPVALTVGLLRAARAAGATVTHPIDVVGFDQQPDHVELRTTDGRRLVARDVILATGYEAARWYLPPAFALASSFAIATAPGTAPAWREDAMLWEASDPYLYARDTADKRIIVGGADIDASDPATRDRLLEAKKGELAAAGARLIGRDAIEPDCAWSATFGLSPDGLPAIGRATNAERIWLAYGFGGNGITFASLAADLLPRLMQGAADADACLFDPYRFD
jgi:glycine/D-amino acid oxidase-like deaminating enzyme